MLFRKVCPRCGRRYPKNFDSCLECGTPLIDTEKEARKAQVKKYLPLIGLLIFCGILVAAVLFVVIPLVQLSVTSGQEFGTLSKTAGQTEVSTYPLNQPASDGNLQITVTKTRDGVNFNTKKFFFVTVSAKNLRPDNTVRVGSGDFILLDASGNLYPSLGLGDTVAQEIAPLDSGSYELMFEIPLDTGSKKIQYSFPASGDRSGQTVLFLLQ